MSDLGFIKTELKSWPAAIQPSALRVFTEVLRQMRFGHPKGTQPDPAQNMGGGFFHGTTPATPGDEFTIAHGFGRTPYLAWPILLLDAVGSSVVSITVSRAADDKRVYFTSTVASAPVSFYIEG